MLIFAPSFVGGKIDMTLGTFKNGRLFGDLSAKAQHLGVPLSHFIGFRLECDECVRSFRSMNPGRLYCSACASRLGERGEN